MAFDDLRAIGREDDGCGPAIILVTVGDVGARVLIDFDQDVALVQQADNNWVAIGDVVHDMAPVAPHCFQVEQDEFMFRTCLPEGRIRPGLPVERRGLRLRHGPVPEREGHQSSGNG